MAEDEAAADENEDAIVDEDDAAADTDDAAAADDEAAIEEDDAEEAIAAADDEEGESSVSSATGLVVAVGSSLTGSDDGSCGAVTVLQVPVIPLPPSGVIPAYLPP